MPRSVDVGSVQYWYQPGHPIKLAEAAAVQTLPGFQVDKVLTIPEELGSWTAITVNSQGRLICAAQHLPGLYRVTVPASNGASEAEVEALQGAAQEVGWSHGLLHAYDSLYVTVAEGNDADREAGVYRLRDTDGDAEYDDLQQLLGVDDRDQRRPHDQRPRRFSRRCETQHRDQSATPQSGHRA